MQLLDQASPVTQLASIHTIMMDVAEALQHLLDTGETRQINLTEMALSEAELDLLADYLGVGEVSFRLDENDHCLLRETAYAGVWWVTHYDENQRIEAEFLEVTRVPDRLLTSLDDIRHAAEAIKHYQ